MATLLNLLKTNAALGLAILLGGCAAGQQYSYSSVPIAMQEMSSAGTVAVGVQDQRAYVVSGGKTERFVGLQRGGFGNPFDVTTGSGGPLADEIRDAIAGSMKARGISVLPVSIPLRDTPEAAKRRLLDAKARRAAFITMREWKSDTMMNTDLHYDMTLSVLDESGNELASSSIKGMDSLGNLGLMSAAAGVGRVTATKLDQLFDNQKIRAALK
jgi:hypothetical protein